MLVIYEALSPLSPREVTDTLTANVSRIPWFRTPKTPFVGHVSELAFRIMRVVRGRDSFNPMMFGRVSPLADGSKVRVVMTLHPAVWVVMIAFTVAVCYFALGRAKTETSGLLFLPLLWIPAVVIFFHDAKRAKQSLRQCIQLRDME
jgi:hypothetical protein